jgi:hypothetical protein
MTHSPLALARAALGVARKALPAYSSRFSRHDFTQHQLFAILVLRQFFRTDYRGTIQLLRDFSDLRSVLDLKKVPNYSTLCYAERRLLKKGGSKPSWAKPLSERAISTSSTESLKPSSTPPGWRAAMSAATTFGVEEKSATPVFAGPN